MEMIVIVTTATEEKEEENFKHLKFWPNEVWKLYHSFCLTPFSCTQQLKLLTRTSLFQLYKGLRLFLNFSQASFGALFS